MKSFLYLLLLFVSVLALKEDDICNHISEDNPIREAFYWEPNPSLFIMLENRMAYVLNGFRWSPQQIIISNIDTFEPPPNVSLINTQLMFPIEYPNKGKRVVVIDYEKVDDVNSFVGHITDFQQNKFTSREKIEVDPYKCESHPEDSHLCTLFSNLPDEKKNLTYLSITSFPPPKGSEPQRLFVYFKELAPSGQCFGCYNSKRYIFANQTTNETSTNVWIADQNASPLCLDLNGTVVNASTRLNDYETGPNNESVFHLIEFSGTQFTVSSVVTHENGIVTNDNKEVLKSGSIRNDFLNCPIIITTTPSTVPTTHSTGEESTIGQSNNGDTSTEGDPNGQPNPTGGQRSESPPSYDEPNVSPSQPSEEGGLSFWVSVLIVILVVGFIALLVVCYLCSRDSGAPQPQAAGQGTQPLDAPNTGATTTSDGKGSSGSSTPGIARTDSYAEAAHDSGTDKQQQSPQALTPTSGPTTPPTDTSAITGPDGTQTPPTDTSAITGPDGTQTTTL